VLGLAVFTLGLIATSAGLIASAAAAPDSQPACAISDTRNHKSFSSLQQAVDAAKAGDTLEVKGNCVGNTSVDRDVTLKGVTNKAFPGTPTLDGNEQGRVLTINGGTTTIQSLTITNGQTSRAGGGIYVATAAVLVNVLVSGNSAGTNNFGGGIEADLGSRLTLINSTVSSNSAGSSGGIDMFRAKATLINSTVTGNQATREPGPETDSGCAFGDPLVIYACAGGIWNYQGTLALTNSTVDSNTAAYRGGGITSYVRLVGGNPVSGLTILSGATSISSNTAGDNGGGIFVNNTITNSTVGVHAADGTATYKDPITGATLPAWTGSVSGNTPNQCFPTLTIGGTNCA
jgi:predicted outer membrane repeat protein